MTKVTSVDVFSLVADIDRYMLRRNVHTAGFRVSESYALVFAHPAFPRALRSYRLSCSMITQKGHRVMKFDRSC